VEESLLLIVDREMMVYRGRQKQQELGGLRAMKKTLGPGHHPRRAHELRELSGCRTRMRWKLLLIPALNLHVYKYKRARRNFCGARMCISYRTTATATTASCEVGRSAFDLCI
jgi:hypothetical protein